MVIVTTQVRAVPRHAPDQPLNFEPDAAAAVSVTFDPAANPCVHVLGHEMPAGLLLICPLPVPALTTVRSLATANVAFVVRAAVIERWHVVLVPVQDPDQLTKTKPEAA